MKIIRNKKNGEFMHPCDVMQIAREIQGLAENWSSFKIGKSGVTAEERFSEPDYNGIYNDIMVVYESSSADNVSKMEASLIDFFKDNEKCENIKDGDGSVKDTMVPSKEYIVYVVYKQ